MSINNKARILSKLSVMFLKLTTISDDMMYIAIKRTLLKEFLRCIELILLFLVGLVDYGLCIKVVSIVYT